MAKNNVVRPVKNKNFKNNATAYAFITPWLIGFLCFTLFPILFMLYVSLTNRKLNGVSDFVGLANYKNMFSSAVFWNSVKVTLFFTILMVIVTTIWAVIMALLLNSVC
ncbi:MAG: hypothetical protein PHN80_01285 [Hespellia sp.]|nr:hypothetical protein [Hespellia sp.]